jgi:ribosomal protein L29
MGFDKFKKEIKKFDINRLNKEIQERKKLLLRWNNPNERMPEYNKSGKLFTQHPFRQVRKELAILNTVVYQRMIGYAKKGGVKHGIQTNKQAI